MENIQIFDIIVISLVTLLGLKGLVRGFTKEFFALVGTVGGVFVASRVAKDTGDIVNSFLPMQNEQTIVLAGFVVALSIFWVLSYLFGSVLAKIFSMSGLGIFDRLFGFVFGASKIFLLFAIISYAVSQVKMINDNLQPKLKDSIVFPILKDAGGYIIKLDASGLQKKVTDKIDTVVDMTKDKIEEVAKEEVKKQVETLKDTDIQKKAQELKKQLEETTSEK